MIIEVSTRGEQDIQIEGHCTGVSRGRVKITVEGVTRDVEVAELMRALVEYL